MDYLRSRGTRVSAVTTRCPNARTACLRCQPVVRHSASLIGYWSAGRVEKGYILDAPPCRPRRSQAGRLQLSEGEHGQLLAVSAATIDHLRGSSHSRTAA